MLSAASGCIFLAAVEVWPFDISREVSTEADSQPDEIFPLSLMGLETSPSVEDI